MSYVKGMTFQLKLVVLNTRNIYVLKYMSLSCVRNVSKIERKVSKSTKKNFGTIFKEYVMKNISYRRKKQIANELYLYRYLMFFVLGFCIGYFIG